MNRLIFPGLKHVVGLACLILLLASCATTSKAPEVRSEQPEPVIAATVALPPPPPPLIVTIPATRIDVPSTVSRPEDGGKVITLWFGTNRKPDSNNPRLFGRMRDNKLHYGTCEVYVPESHEFGSTGRSDWNLYKRFMGKDEPLKLLRDPLALEEGLFLSSIKQALDKEGDNGQRVLIFIHGYNNSFSSAAIRTAQIWTDLDMKGVPAFFSWPSRDDVKRYTDDEATIDASEFYLEKFLTKVASAATTSSINIIAHSMGNRALLRVVSKAAAAAERHSGIRFSRIFLAAPDVDIDLFRQLAAAYPLVSDKTTLYISRNDKAVHFSEILHDYYRVGSPPPFAIVDGIDTIEVVGKEGLLSLGHNFFAESGSVLGDIRSIILTGSPSEKRKRVPEVGSNLKNQEYWILNQ